MQNRNLEEKNISQNDIEINFEAEQQKVLNSENKNVIVSASAGSGKTTVMIEKLIKLITEKNISVKNLLVLTYTKAAAEEMKQKLIASLYRVAVNNEDMLNQIDDVSTADISTIHSFFQKLIKRNFMALNLNPAFSVVEEQEAEMLKNQALRQTLEAFSKKFPMDLERLLDYYGKSRNDKTIKKLLEKINIFLSAVYSKNSFNNHTATLFCNENINENIAVFYVNKELCEMANFYTTEFLKLNKKAQNLGADKYVAFTQNIYMLLAQISQTPDEKIYFKQILEALTQNFLQSNIADISEKFSTKDRQDLPVENNFDPKIKIAQNYNGRAFKNLKKINNNLENKITQVNIYHNKLKLCAQSVCSEKSFNFKIFRKHLENFSNAPQTSFFKNYAILTQSKLPSLFKSEEFSELYEEINQLKTKLGKAKDEFASCDYTPQNVQDSAKEICKTVEILLALNDDFENQYSNIKRKKNILDFNDLEKLALELLQNQEIRESVQRQFDFIFVDEYQDANNLQEKILSLISSGNNRFMVGDVKQSIYGFRQAEPDIFLNIEQSFANNENSEALNLNSNFRSHADILNFVNQIFSVIMTEGTAKINYAQNALLVPKANYIETQDENLKHVEIDIIKVPEATKKKLPPKLYSVRQAAMPSKCSLCEPAELEARLVALRISQLVGKKIYDAKLKAEREIKFKDICLLLNSRGEYLDKFCSTLAEFNIPLYANTNASLFEDEEVLVFVSMLKLCINSSDDVALATVLHSPIGDLTYNELAVIRLLYPAGEDYYSCIVNFLKYGKNIWQTAPPKTVEDNILQGGGAERTELLSRVYFNKLDIIEIEKLFKKLHEFNKALQTFKFNVSYKGIFFAINELINKYDYFSYLYQRGDGIEKVEKIKKFAADFNQSSYNYNVFDFLEFVENSPELARAPNYVSGDNCVSVTTIHASKGLEYPVVFLINAGAKFGGRPRDGNIELNTKFGIALKRFDSKTRNKNMSIMFDAMQRINKSDVFAEKLRLLYVALTRAKNHLFIVGCTKQSFKKLYSNFQIKKASNFLNLIVGTFSEEEIAQVNMLKNIENKIYKTNIHLAESLNEAQTFKPERAVGSANKEAIQILRNYLTKKLPQNQEIALKNSVTALAAEEADAYASFNPRPRRLDVSEHTKIKLNQIGSMYHEVLEQLEFKKINCVLDVEGFLKESSIYKYSDVENINLDAKKLFNCVQIIKQFNYKQMLKEQKFMLYVPHKEIVEGGSDEKVLVQGVIDLLLLGNQNILIDYKFTTSASKETIVNRYKMQLKLYKKAAEEALNIKINKAFLLLINTAEMLEINL